jgi:hypothetical protein
MPSNFPVAYDALTRIAPTDYMNDPGKQGDVIITALQEAVESVQATLGKSGETSPATVEHRLSAIPAQITSEIDAAQNGLAYPAKNIGALINALTSSSGIAWSGTTGATGGVDSSFPGLDGENTLWIECPIASGGVGYARAIVTQNYRLSATDTISIRVKVEKASSLRFIQLQFVQGAVVMSLSSTTDGAFEAGGFGWWNLTWKLSDFSVSGGSAAYGSDFTSFRLQIGAAGSGGAIGKIAFSGLRRNASSNSYLVFAADSSYDDVYDVYPYFAATGIPLSIYTNCDLLDVAGYLTSAQATALYNHSSGVFELANYPTYKPSLSHTPDGVAQSQSVSGAGNLTLNGSLTASGTATFGVPRKIVLTGTAISRTIVFTVTGSLSGSAKTDYMLGPAYANGLVESASYFDTITQISVSGAISGTCKVGTSYTVAEIVANITDNANKLTARGFVGSQLNVAYNGGEISQPLHDAMVSISAKSGRTTYNTQTCPRNQLIHDKAFNPLLLSGLNLGTAIATLQSQVDDVVARGGIMVLFFHQIAATVDGVNPTKDDLATILAYAKNLQQQGKLQCIKLSSINAATHII